MITGIARTTRRSDRCLANGGGASRRGGQAWERPSWALRASGTTSTASVPPSARCAARWCRAARRWPGRGRSAGRAGRPRRASKSGGRPRPLSATVTCSCLRNRCAETTTSPVVGRRLVPGREAVLDRVEQQLVEDHHQRGGDLGRQHAEAALPPHAAPSISVAATSVAARGDPVDDAVELDRLVADIDSVSCTSAIEATRRTDSSSAARASGAVDPAGLQPQQRGDRLQVVLHPVVDLPDGGVLGDQLRGPGGVPR